MGEGVFLRGQTRIPQFLRGQRPNVPQIFYDLPRMPVRFDLQQPNGNTSGWHFYVVTV